MQCFLLISHQNKPTMNLLDKNIIIFKTQRDKQSNAKFLKKIVPMVIGSRSVEIQVTLKVSGLGYVIIDVLYVCFFLNQKGNVLAHSLCT